jgi:hypothetical protein
VFATHSKRRNLLFSDIQVRPLPARERTSLWIVRLEHGHLPGDQCNAPTIADDGVGPVVFGTCMGLYGTFRDMIGDEALVEHGWIFFRLDHRLSLLRSLQSCGTVE